jgi:hypothetical protein
MYTTLLGNSVKFSLSASLGCTLKMGTDSVPKMLESFNILAWLSTRENYKILSLQKYQDILLGNLGK